MRGYTVFGKHDRSAFVFVKAVRWKLWLGMVNYTIGTELGKTILIYPVVDMILETVFISETWA